MRSLPHRDTNLSQLFLRIGLAAVFLYAGIDAFREPDVWTSYVPSVATHFTSLKTALDAISVVQIVVALLLLADKFVRYAAFVAALLLGGIVAFNLNALLITFRDVGLFFMALALVFDSKS